MLTCVFSRRLDPFGVHHSTHHSCDASSQAEIIPYKPRDWWDFRRRCVDQARQTCVLVFGKIYLDWESDPRTRKHPCTRVPNEEGRIDGHEDTMSRFFRCNGFPVLRVNFACGDAFGWSPPNTMYNRQTAKKKKKRAFGFNVNCMIGWRLDRKSLVG